MFTCQKNNLRKDLRSIYAQECLLVEEYVYIKQNLSIYTIHIIDFLRNKNNPYKSVFIPTLNMYIVYQSLYLYILHFWKLFLEAWIICTNQYALPSFNAESYPPFIDGVCLFITCCFSTKKNYPHRSAVVGQTGGLKLAAWLVLRAFFCVCFNLKESLILLGYVAALSFFWGLGVLKVIH